MTTVAPSDTSDLGGAGRLAVPDEETARPDARDGRGTAPVTASGAASR
jgi:hypothetical protein